MKNNKHTIFFLILLTFLIALIVHPFFFNWSNRIEPWVLGVPFVMFWLLFVSTLICLAMIAWYITDSITGNLDLDIEVASEEEMKSWKGES